MFCESSAPTRRPPAFPPTHHAPQAGLTAWDALRAALPAGTVSGAPKVRARRALSAAIAVSAHYYFTFLFFHL